MTEFISDYLEIAGVTESGDPLFPGCNGDTRSTPAWHMHHGRLWKQFAPGINPHMVRALCMSMLDDNKELERPIECPTKLGESIAAGMASASCMTNRYRWMRDPATQKQPGQLAMMETFFRPHQHHFWMYPKLVEVDEESSDQKQTLMVCLGRIIREADHTGFCLGVLYDGDPEEPWRWRLPSARTRSKFIWLPEHVATAQAVRPTWDAHGSSHATWRSVLPDDHEALLTQMKKWLGSETEWAAKLEAAKAAGREQGRRTVAGDLVWCNKIEGGLLAQVLKGTSNLRLATELTVRKASAPLHCRGERGVTYHTPMARDGVTKVKRRDVSFPVDAFLVPEEGVYKVSDSHS